MSEINSKGNALTGGGLLAKNSLFNLIGQCVPLVAAIIAIPLLIRGLGLDRFGVLTLAWMVIGYFSLFDFGLGRALTQLVSKKLGTGEEQGLPVLVWTSLSMMFALGVIGAIVLLVSSYWIVNSALKIPEALIPETQSAFLILAVGIPIVIVTTGLGGLLSAFQRFDILNKIKIPMGIINYFAPLLVLPFSHSLYPITAVLVFGRFIACLIHIAACLHVMPNLRSEFNLQFSKIKPLFHFGAWMTVTNIVGPLMVYLDRFVIGGVVSVAAVAFYATPYEIVTKMLIIPVAIVGVLFPALAASHACGSDKSLRIFIRGTKYIALILFPLVLLCSAFAHEGLQLWLGNEFAKNSTLVLQLLGIGVYINGIALVFITFIQAIGRPDLSAKLHFIELPFYLLILWWAIHNFGILGAAVVWVIRVAVDGVVLFIISKRYFAEHNSQLKTMAFGLLISTVCVCIPMLLIDLLQRLVVAITLFCIYLYVARYRVLEPDEREYLKLLLSKLQSSFTNR